MSQAFEQADRLPPHSTEAEQGALGCILLDPATCVPECVSRLGDGVEAFYDMRHQRIYETMLAMFDAQMAIDIITVSDWLKMVGNIDEIGGMSYINSLQENTPSAANLGAYLDIIIERLNCRKIIKIGTSAVAAAFSGADDPNTIIESVAQDFLDIAAGKKADEEMLMRPLMTQVIEVVERCHMNQGKITGIPSGYSDIDHLTWGFQPTQMIVLAGRPSMGKTSLAMNMVDYASVDQRIPIIVFSLEMRSLELGMRLLCSRARVNFRDIQAGKLQDRDFPKLTTASNALANSKIIVNDASGLSIMGLRARARRAVQQHGIKMVVVDYLGLMGGDRKGGDSRQTEVASVSSGMKAMAKELAIPVLVLCQLNRNTENDKERKPRLSDLRESGAIEQDADLVMLLSKDLEADKYDDPSVLSIDLDVAKNRSGPIGTVPMTFLRKYTRFEQRAGERPEETQTQAALI